MDTINASNPSNKLSAIDRALAAAQARKNMKTSETPAAPATASKDKTRVVDTDKAAEKAAREARRAQQKAERATERSERRAAKEAAASDKKAAHLKKVSRAASKLPPLSDSAQALLDEVKTNLGRVEQSSLALHIQHFVRLKATEMSAGRRFRNGQKVRIVAGDLNFIGAVGTVESARPLRCFVNVPGAKKPVYVFTSELELVEEQSAATGTEG